MSDTPKQEAEYMKAYDTYSDALFRHAYFRVSNRDASLDLVQETFTKTWIQITKGEVISNFQAYLYHVLNNLIIDFYRKKKSLSLDALTEDGFDPVGAGKSDVMEEALHNELLTELDKLPERDRDVVVMRYIDGLQVNRIAQLLEETENSIFVRLHRAIKKLRSNETNEK
jgi:RNA polymerase sigma-70 factor (ECF subfamily)